VKQNLVNVLKILVTVGLFAFLLTRIDLQQVWGIIVHANVPLFLLALVLYFVAIILGAVKWQILVRAQDIDAPLGALLNFSLMGLFFGNVMPSNIGGDVVRAYDLARVTKGRAEAAAISVLVDRLMGLFAFFSAAVVTAVLATLMLAQAQQLEQIEIVTVIAASAFMALCAALFSRRIARRLAFIFEIGPLTRLKPTAENVYHALQVYRFRYRALASNVLLSVSIVVLTAFIWYLLGQAVGITHVGFFTFLLFNPLIAFLLLIPISFNGLGQKEAIVVFFFGLVGVPQENALAMSLLFHVLIVVTSLPGGFVWFSARQHHPEEIPPPNTSTASELLHPLPVESKKPDLSL
jgi:glycosyltransferase 2 family protein